MREVSGITHRHFRSVLSCFIFSKIASNIFKGYEKLEAYKNAIEEVRVFISTKNYNPDEVILFERILSGTLIDEAEEKIYSSGYVLHTLEAAIWCFIKGNSYKETVLMAVNLGADTDTTACVTGALAGLYYGINEIPEEWKATLARRDDIISLSNHFQKCIDNLILAKS